MVSLLYNHFPEDIQQLFFIYPSILQKLKKGIQCFFLVLVLLYSFILVKPLKGFIFTLRIKFKCVIWITRQFRTFMILPLLISSGSSCYTSLSILTPLVIVNLKFSSNHTLFYSLESTNMSCWNILLSCASHPTFYLIKCQLPQWQKAAPGPLTPGLCIMHSSYFCSTLCLLQL